LPLLANAELRPIPSIWGHRAGNPVLNPVDASFIRSAVREWLATLRDNEDLVSVGAYVPGSNPRIDTALAKRDAIGRFLCQPPDMAVRLSDNIAALQAL